MAGVSDKGKLKKYKKRMRWDAILDRLPRNVKLKGAEIGVLNGNTAGRLLKERPLLIHIMIDPWTVPPKDSTYAKQADCNGKKSQREHEEAYQRALTVTKFAANRTKVWRMTSEQAYVNVPDGSLDFVFIDGDHSYEGVKLDISLWKSKVKKGGWIGGHDYHHETRPDLGGVTVAVDESWKDTGLKIEEDANHTWFVRIK